MKIGIAAPINIELLKPLLNNKANDLPPGNSFSYISELIISFIKKGISVHVVTLDHRVSKIITISHSNLSLTVIPSRKSGIKRTLSFYNYEVSQLLSVFNKLDCNLLHAHWTYEYAWAAVKSKKRHLITVHDAPWRIVKFLPPFWYRFPRAIGAFWALRKAQEVTAVSPYIIRYLKQKRFLNKNANVYLSLNGVTPLELSPKNKNKSKDILFATVLQGFTYFKNGENAIKAFSKVHRSTPNTRLIMFGTDYGSGESAEKWAIKNNLEAGIEFRGLKPKKEVMTFLQENVDVVVNPCREESFSLAIVEALMCGLAVVGGKYSGAVPDVLDNGNAGILCDVNDPSDIAKAMKSLLNQELRNKFRENAREYAISNFSFDNAVNQYIAIYNSILG